MNITITTPKIEDLEKIHEIEKECFPTPWDKGSIYKDMFDNHLAIYFVAKIEDELVGYGGMWHVVTEGHITNIAVTSVTRQKGVASKILGKLIEIADEKNMIGITLEVRESNKEAINLYKKFDFEQEGIRKEYYKNPVEDAIIMWKYLDFIEE